METANIIISQIGQLALRMLGAKDLVAIERGVQFAIRGCKTVNKVVIELDPYDAYVVKFWKISGTKMRLVSSEYDIQCAELCDSITRNTGLYTSL